MQPTPLRLSQALWTAFRAAKPVHRQSLFQNTRLSPPQLLPTKTAKRIPLFTVRQCYRSYSDVGKSSDVEKKVEEVKKRIDETLDSRADIVQDAEPILKQKKEETIVHTLPEASSIVNEKKLSSSTPRSSQKSDEKSGSGADQTFASSFASNNAKYAEWATSQWNKSPLPSQIASLRSRATKRFSHIMDNFQSNIVVAAHHLNDLTGYTGIERLKKEIETQESTVKEAKQHVKDSRERYAAAISTRSDTQREVNDLLHRKHAWSPTDLERFTNLYRSDHANEQSEQRAHQALSDAEAQYEEASTRLAKSILARYHEEQIWSDKIRQMSTWGTWGLMGLNVLLFIVFQIAIEPWRRRRLVKGFEEKVQAALAEKEKSTDEKLAFIRAERNGDEIIQEAVQKQPEGLVATAAEEAAELIADAITGTTENKAETPKTEEIEEAAELVTQRELEAEDQGTSSLSTATTAGSSPTAIEATPPDSPQSSSGADPATTIPVPILAPELDYVQTPQTWQEQLESSLNSTIRSTKNAYIYYRTALIDQFNEKEHVVLSKREITTRVFEGVAAGIALTCGVMFVIVRGR